jgi:hypothetical protein
MAYKFTKLNIGNAIASVGGYLFKLLAAFPPAGLYDLEGNCIATWDELVNTYGMRCDKNYTENGAIAFYSNAPRAVIALYYGHAKSVEVIIGSDVTNIGDYSFYKLSGMLKSLAIPDSVTNIGAYAFSKCDSLANLSIGNGLKSIGELAFNECDSLTSVVIQNSVTSLGGGVFERCSNLTSVVLSNSMTATGNYSFHYCKKLTSVTIPDSVKFISEGVFDGCSSLTNLTFGKATAIIYRNAFRDCSKMESFDFTACTTVPTLSNQNAFLDITSDFKIYVPASLADKWKAATNWATYADQIVGV